MTGLVKAGMSNSSEIAFSMERMNSIIDVDFETATMTVEAGVTLQEAQEAADAHDLMLPLDLGARGSATIARRPLGRRLGAPVPQSGPKSSSRWVRGARGAVGGFLAGRVDRRAGLCGTDVGRRGLCAAFVSTRHRGGTEKEGA